MNWKTDVPFTDVPIVMSPEWCDPGWYHFSFTIFLWSLGDDKYLKRYYFSIMTWEFDGFLLKSNNSQIQAKLKKMRSLELQQGWQQQELMMKKMELLKKKKLRMMTRIRKLSWGSSIWRLMPHCSQLAWGGGDRVRLTLKVPVIIYKL